MSWRYREATLTEMLSDPIVRSLMKADRVDPMGLEANLRYVAMQMTERGNRHECSCLVPHDQPEDLASRLSTR
jgi:hypothetical protein